MVSLPPHGDRPDELGEDFPTGRYPAGALRGQVPAYRREQQVQRLLTLWDAVIWVAVTLLALLVTRSAGHSAAPLFVKLWVVAGLLGLILARQPRRQSPLHARLLHLRAPVFTLLVGVLLLLSVGLPALWFVGLTLLCLLWLGLMLLIRRQQDGWGAQVRLGVLRSPASSAVSEERVPGPQGQLRLVYVPVTPEQPGALAQLSGLLLTPGAPLTPAQQHLVQHAQTLRLPIWSKSDFDEDLSGKVALGLIRRDWLDEGSFHSDYLPVKRLLDLFFLVLALPLLLPLMAVVALVVLINSGRPILFWQERIGQSGQPFRLVKFRTMTRDSERSGPAFAQHGDLRVTPVGNFLRKFRLDELPQFWNVLRGEMSIIGPRPEQWAFAADFEESIPLYPIRHWVKPGITGWAQVNQGYTATVVETTEKVEYDLYYVKYVSVGLDALIVWKTVLTILTGFGAR